MTPDLHVCMYVWMEGRMEGMCVCTMHARYMHDRSSALNSKSHTYTHSLSLSLSDLLHLYRSCALLSLPFPPSPFGHSFVRSSSSSATQRPCGPACLDCMWSNLTLGSDPDPADLHRSVRIQFAAATRSTLQMSEVREQRRFVLGERLIDRSDDRRGRVA